MIRRLQDHKKYFKMVDTVGGIKAIAYEQKMLEGGSIRAVCAL